MLRELAQAVRERRVSARELTEHALRQIEERNPTLNAVIAVRAVAATAEAEALDRSIAAGEEPGALAGVPFLVKDIEDLTGMPTTFGSVLFAEAHPAEADGLAPERLRGAGAVAIGKTNTPEFACEGFTANLLWGVTRNPWGPAWTTGGSSGGSAAAVAAGIAPIATATDGGGSIRIPASFCGLVGIKPTNGVVARRPIPSWIDLSTDGPFATSVEDLRVLLEILAGPVTGDPTALPGWHPGPGGLPGRVLAAPRFAPWGPLPAPVAACFERALETLQGELGLPVEPVEPEELFRAGNPDLDWFALVAPEHISQLGRGFVQGGLDRMHPTSRAFFEDGLRVTLDEYLAARRRRFAYVRELDERLGADVVIASPTIASEGWLADGRMPGSDHPEVPPEVYNTAVQNITGHPAISIPAGTLPNGLPFGLQVTGPRFRDDLLLDLATAWERVRPWPAVAPGYEPFDAGIA